MTIDAISSSDQVYIDSDVDSGVEETKIEQVVFEFFTRQTNGSMDVDSNWNISGGICFAAGEDLTVREGVELHSDTVALKGRVVRLLDSSSIEAAQSLRIEAQTLHLSGAFVAQPPEFLINVERVIFENPPAESLWLMAAIYKQEEEKSVTTSTSYSETTSVSSTTASSTSFVESAPVSTKSSESTQVVESAPVSTETIQTFAPSEKVSSYASAIPGETDQPIHQGPFFL